MNCPECDSRYSLVYHPQHYRADSFWICDNCHERFDAVDLTEVQIKQQLNKSPK